MFFLVYVSSEVRPLSDQELSDILEVSQRNNRRAGITGMLLYKGGNFMQFLEGPKEQVLALLEKIQRDARHRGLITVLHEERGTREFAGWSMAFKRLDTETMPEIPGYGELLDLPLTSEQFLLQPSRCLRLLLNFRSSIRSGAVA